MKKRVCIIMSAVGLLAIAQTAGAKVNGSILTEPNWIRTSNNSQTVVAASTANNQFMLANPISSNSPTTFTSPDGFTSTESHHGGGGGDGIEGHNIFGIGVGFVGGLSTITSIYNVGGGPGYTASVIPGIRVDWEKGLTSNIGIGIFFQYSSATLSSTYTNQTFTGTYDSFGNPIYTNTTYTDKYTLTFMTIAARGNYHFMTSGSFDPYAGITLGYVLASETYSSTDPNAGTGAVGAAAGAALGAQLGARYFFNDHIGAFFELAFCTNYGENYINLGLSIKL